jgi:hypothetical protein
MKRYLVFGGDNYYPCGGWDDLLGEFDNLEDAKLTITHGKINACKHKGIEPLSRDWNHIVDLETGEEVK